jgi:hypothetical protein
VTTLSYCELLQARAGARSTVADIACPFCGPLRTGDASKRKVMRTWLTTSGVLSFNCVRCDAKGHLFPDCERRGETTSIASDADEDARERRRKLEWAAEIWRAARPIAGTPGADYLDQRGIDLDQVPRHGGLRWYARCPWGKGDYLPCIIARYSDAVTGELRGIRRRPIKQGETARTLGPMGGCVIRLWPDEDVTQGLCLAEGVETALFAASRITCRGTFLRPMWAAGSAGNMQTFPVLAGIDALTLLVDNDESGRGEEAARCCANRWERAGREVILRMPKQLGADFNDLRSIGGAS